MPTFPLVYTHKLMEIVLCMDPTTLLKLIITNFIIFTCFITFIVAGTFCSVHFYYCTEYRCTLYRNTQTLIELGWLAWVNFAWPSLTAVQINCGWLVYAPSLYTCTFKQLNYTNPVVDNLNQWFTHFSNRVYSCTAVQLHCSPVSVHLYCKQIIYFWVD